MDRLSIVIVNWNTGRLLAKCLQSLLELPEDEQKLLGKVVVVDNDSSDHSFERARDAVGRGGMFEFMKLSENVGFAAANNRGISWLGENGYKNDHVLLLNPDTKVLPGALRTMLDVLGQNKNVGIVGPHLLNPDGSTQGSVRPFPTFADFVLYMLKLGRLRQVYQEGQFDYGRGQTVDQVMGAAFLIRQEVLVQLGGLDEGFFMWFEEVDYCKQAQEAGWQTYYTPAAEVVHYQGVSFSHLIAWQKTIPWLKSMLHYARKHFQAMQWWTLVFLVPVSLVLSIPAAGWHVYVHVRKKQYL